LKASEISWPNVYPAPRGEIPHPQRSSGSDLCQLDLPFLDFNLPL
jgi:hypothetical protein